MKTRFFSNALIMVLAFPLAIAMALFFSVPAMADDTGSTQPADAIDKLPGRSLMPAGMTTPQSADAIHELLNPGAPEGWSDEDESNPYGYEKDVPFRLYEDAEMYSFITDPGNFQTKISSIYERYKKTDGSAFLDEGSWEKTVDTDPTGEPTYTEGNIKDHWFVDSVPLDIGYNADRPQKTCIGFIGARQKELGSGNFDVNIWVYDTKSKKYSNVLKIGEIKNLAAASRVDDPETMLYQMKHFLSITAGDYDNDSKDTIVAYGAFHDGPKLTEISVTGDGSAAPVISSKADSNAMLHQKYLSNFSSFSSDTSADGKMKLGCSLATGDVTGDKTDDLIAVSYTQIISDGFAQTIGDEIVMPYLTVSTGGQGKTGASLLAGDEGLNTYVGTETKDSTEVSGCTERLTVSAPTAVVADTEVTDGGGIVMGGYAEAIYRFKNDKTINEVGRNRVAVALFVYNCDGKSLKAEMNGKEELAKALKPVSGGASLILTPPKVPVAAVSLDGKGAKDKIFAGGSFFGLTKAGIKNEYTVPCLDQVYTAGDFGGESLQTVYVDTTAVASLNKVGGNYESIAFALVGVTKATSGFYAGSPYAYYFRIGAAGPAVDPDTSRVTGHYGTTKDKLQTLTNAASVSVLDNCKFYLDDSSDTRINFVMCPVDYVDDGLIIKYNGKKYVYADPKVQAVLQASPCFEQIGQTAGGTSYEFSNEFSYSDEKSNVFSWGVGFASEVTSPFVDASLRLGYANETRTWRETEFTNEVTVSFDADHDSVIVHRVPVVYYMYDVWKPDTATWEDGGLGVSYVKPAEYQQLSVEEYNSFAEEYNTEGRKRFSDKGLNPDDFTTLDTIGDGKYLGCEGHPEKYYSGVGDAPAGYALIDENVHALGYNGGSDATEMITGSTVTTGKETSEGVSFEFEIMGGVEVVKGGAYVSIESMKGHAVSSANASSTGVRTSVNNLDEGELLAEGYTHEQIRAHSFKWLPAKWDSGLEYQYKGDDGVVGLTRTVPVYGYSLSEVLKPYDLTNADITLDPSSFDYDGKAKTPAVTVKIGDKTLPGTAYSVSYTADGEPVDECIDPNTYLAVIKGAGTAIGQKTAPFSIVDTGKTNISNAEMTLDRDEFEYDGTAKSPSVTVKLDGNTLEKGRDYDLEYAQIGGFVDECVNPGIYTVIAEGKGDYTGSVEKEFSILTPGEPISIQDAEVVLSSKEFTYNGETQKPSVKTIGGMKLERGKDYTLTWSDTTSIHAGAYTVEIKGKGNYIGTTLASYDIKAASINGASVTGIKAQTYTGKALEQSPVIEVGSRTLESGKDYTIDYKNNIKAGTASMTIGGKGNYTGSISKTFKINKAANPLKISPKTATVKYSKLKKKAQTLAVTKVVKFTKKGQGKMSYTKASGNKKITINKTTGKVTVKKGLKKGSYKVKVKVKAAGNANYKPSAVKTVTFKIRVK